MASDLVRSNQGGRPGRWPMLDIHREIDRLFEDFFEGGPLGLAGGSSSFVATPRLDVQESQGELCVIAELPGVTQSDIDLSLDGDVLTIRGEKKQEQESNEASYHVMERRYGRFERSVQLPFAPDPSQVNAKFENGVLRVRMPRQGGQQRAHRIEVQSGSGPAIQGSADSDQGQRAKGSRGQGTSQG
jgi:HSP20 family protein